MPNYIDVVLGISAPLKVAWALWLAWAAGQVVWYRRAREVVLPPMMPSPRPARTPQSATTPAAPAELSEAAPV